MQKFKKQDREKIMSDWLTCVPSMRRERSMSLMKRNGPLVIGVYLKESRGNTWYNVIPHVHNLTRPTNSVSLTLAYPLRTKSDTYYADLTLKSHEREFPDACRRLHKQTLFPLTEGLTLDQVMSAYDVAIDRKLTLDSHELLYEDIISILTWCGQTTEASKRLAKYIALMSEWEERIFKRLGGRSRFFEKLHNIIEDREILERVREQQIESLNLEKLPDYGLKCL